MRVLFIIHAWYVVRLRSLAQLIHIYLEPSLNDLLIDHVWIEFQLLMVIVLVENVSLTELPLKVVAALCHLLLLQICTLAFLGL